MISDETKPKDKIEHGFRLGVFERQNRGSIRGFQMIRNQKTKSSMDSGLECLNDRIKGRFCIFRSCPT